jgi:hypothetical protein
MGAKVLLNKLSIVMNPESIMPHQVKSGDMEVHILHTNKISLKTFPSTQKTKQNLWQQSSGMHYMSVLLGYFLQRCETITAAH